MGLFGSVGKFIGGAVNTVVKTVTNPAKLTTAVLTGGASVVAPNVFKPVTQAVQGTLYNPAVLSGVLTRGGSFLQQPGTFTAQPWGGVQPMSLNLGGILGQVGTIFGGNQNPYFQGISNIANLASQFVPQQTSLAAAPRAVGPAMTAIRGVGRKFFDKFPNLAVAIQGYRNMGRNVTRKQLWSLMKRFGPDFLIAGGILSAAAVSELMMAGPGYRRMNPANGKALRRALRRIKSFHNMCTDTDVLRRSRSRGKTCRTGGTQFVRQG